jgi:uncharacterized protein (TIGR02147 family)
VDFVQHLEKEYQRRQAANQGYSLRAFARDVGVDQSALSKVLARKRILTDEIIQRIASNLRLSSAQTRKFLNQSSAVTQPAYVDLEYDRFVAVSDWYHDSLLELIDTVDFEPCTKWISGRLGVRETQIKGAVRRLIKLDLLEISSTGEWIDKSKINSIHPKDISPIALRNYQKQILANSHKAIDSLKLEQRSHTSVTFSGSAEQIEKAKKVIEKCRRDVAEILRSSETKTDVFQIQISLFPVTKGVTR